VGRAARNNARWCDAVCRALGIPTRIDENLWVALGGPPPLYPDVVTLRPQTSADDVAAALGGRAGGSVKDSFAMLDLGAAGFDVLFEAQWIWREPAVGGSPSSAWHMVGDRVAFAGWLSLHDAPTSFGQTLMADPRVRLVLLPDGAAVSAIAATNVSEDEVGLSNVVTARGELVSTWTSLVAAVSCWFPDLPIVGYERDTGLVAARTAGFEAVGPLRVWSRAD
jgi:hypothetical protein